MKRLSPVAMQVVSAAVAATLVLATGCTGRSTGTSTTSTAPSATAQALDTAAVPPESKTGADSEVVVDGLNGPTQFVLLDDGRFLIAQLNGDEDEKSGQVIVVDPTSKTTTVLLSGLDKPTGVIRHQGAVWVMMKRGIVRATWDGEKNVGPIETVLKDLPYNGRSEGTLTVLGDERIAYETSGNNEGGDVIVDSGRLWAYDTGTKQTTAIAVGLKNAYAHALLPDGRLAVTEIGDNIVDAPLEEINLVDLAVKQPSYGWPNCPAPTVCPQVVSPLATFPAKATPGGIALAQDGMALYVTLLTTGQLVEVPLDGGAQRVVAQDLVLPLHAVIDDEGRILVGEHGAGRIVAVRVTV
jgi:glucose/arabinose dehydrogenase